MGGASRFYRIHHSTNPFDYPQAYQTEQMNRFIKTMIRSFVDKNQQDWYVHLCELMFAYNTAMNNTNRLSPAFLNYGQEPRPKVSLKREEEGPVDISEPDREKLIERMKRLRELQDLVTLYLEEANVRQTRPIPNN